MEVNFDKQIDAILQDLAKGNSFAETVPKSHLDADELSAFAEKALPTKAHLRVTEHLADCSKCRKILINLVSLNIEAESETIHEEVKNVAEILPIPWYRRLFIFPQLAYTMGALALVFSGMLGYLVWQSSKDANLNIAQADKVSEKTMGPSGASSESEGRVVETSSSNSANTASSANTTANVAIPVANTATNSSAPTAPANTFSDKSGEPMATPVPASSDREIVGKTSEKSDSDSKLNKDVAKEEAENKKGGEVPASKVATEQPTNEVTDNNIARQQELVTQNRSNQGNIMTPDTGSQRNMPPPAPRKAEPRRDEEDSQGGKTSNDQLAKKKTREVKPETTKNIGGRTFRNVKGVWTDLSYTGGSTVNVRRGSNEYKKLDSGLQNIGNSLSGTVIVVWGGKNYKIQ